jgi:thiol-disulfide isomerase/thioredoxin
MGRFCFNLKYIGNCIRDIARACAARNSRYARACAAHRNSRIPTKRIAREAWSALLGVAALFATCTIAAAVEPGTQIPAVRMPGMKAPLDLSSFRGKVIYLDFWASWCGPCRESFPYMNDLQKRYGPSGLAIVAVNLDDTRKLGEDFMKPYNPSFTIGFDGSGGYVAKYFGVTGLPATVLIGGDGRVIEQHRGFRSEDKPEIEARIQSALAALAPGGVAARP